LCAPSAAAKLVPMGSPAASKLVRRAGPRVVARAAELVIVGAGGRVHVMTDETAEVARVILGELARPRTRAELRDVVGRASGSPIEEGGVVDQIVAALLDAGAIGESAGVEARAWPRAIGARPRVVLALTGAIHSIQAPAMIQALQARNMDVRVAASRSAARLVRATGLEALTHHPVTSSMWSRDPATPVPHLELAEWADLVVVCPASATTIARIAQGDFSDVVSAVALSTAAPVVVAPSMNEAMLEAPSVKRNLAQLAEDGFWIVAPSDGIEVADAPGARRVHRGTAPGAEALADVVSVVVARARERAAALDPPGLPRSAAAWDALWQAPDAAARAWEEDAIDEAFVTELRAAALPGARVLDVGTGSGLVAAALARAGHRVVATDVSRAALERARAETSGLDVTLVVDDACSSGLVGPFDLALDRACLHSLPASRHAAYAATMERLVAPGGLLVVVCDAPDATAQRATHRFEESDLRAIFGEAFEVGAAMPAVLRHRGAASPARSFVLQRAGVRSARRAGG
jgi:SAM-dependent methyltransferase/3-polyprenyl-4-hydroxybenzoate decarboxylase